VRLVGTKSNRSAIGARVSVEAAGTKQFREVSGGTNFGCLPLEQHFGLGNLESIDAVIVRWPVGWCSVSIILKSTRPGSSWKAGGAKDVYAHAAHAKPELTRSTKKRENKHAESD